LNFTFEALEAARAALSRLDEFSDRLRTLAGGAAPTAVLPAWAQQALETFTAALDDDLNISAGLAALFDMITAGNRAMNERALAVAGAAAVLGLLDRFDGVLGFIKPEAQAADAEALALLEQRQAARKAKNWPESDRLRDELKKRGWVIQDTPQGPKLKRG
jgi:cysteinyl-tRNA synthetase